MLWQHKSFSLNYLICCSSLLPKKRRQKKKKKEKNIMLIPIDSHINVGPHRSFLLQLLSAFTCHWHTSTLPLAKTELWLWPIWPTFHCMQFSKMHLATKKVLWISKNKFHKSMFLYFTIYICNLIFKSICWIVAHIGHYNPYSPFLLQTGRGSMDDSLLGIQKVSGSISGASS